MSVVTFHLEVFDGPLDLLLHLLSKNKVEISDIPIADILEQYLEYIKQMRAFDLDVASEFITMAAQLMFIKSKMLLPAPESDGREDPRMALAEALYEYQKVKELGAYLDTRADFGKNIFIKQPETLERKPQTEYQCSIDRLLKAVEAVFERNAYRLPPPVSAFAEVIGGPEISVDEKVDMLSRQLRRQKKIKLEDIFLSAGSRTEIVAFFLAVLELLKIKSVVLTEHQDGYILTDSGE